MAPDVTVQSSLYVYSGNYLPSWSCSVTCLVGMVTSTLLPLDTELPDCYQAYRDGLD